jgi:peptidoglycan hydrolase-like protein with peptidoglycan-binding domain
MTREAIRNYQRDNNLPMDGYASGQLLTAIRNAGP